jgi:hypothetical protein
VECAIFVRQNVSLTVRIIRQLLFALNIYGGETRLPPWAKDLQTWEPRTSLVYPTRPPVLLSRPQCAILILILIPKLPLVLWWPKPRHSQTPILSNRCHHFYRAKRRKHPNFNIILPPPTNLLCPTRCHLILSYSQGLMPTFIPYQTSVDISYPFQ